MNQLRKFAAKETDIIINRLSNFKTSLLQDPKVIGEIINRANEIASKEKLSARFLTDIYNLFPKVLLSIAFKPQDD